MKINHYILLSLITAALLIPFSGKPFHLDDPMYIWAARHILENPLDFYGFDVNWTYTSLPMSRVMKNPPLVSYYIAFAGSLFGWSERAIHMALILPAVAMALGTYTLARVFSPKPLLASLIAVITPVFIVSATTVMSDVMMLAFWVWAVVFWVYGVEKDSRVLILVSGVFIVLSTLTKYFGISLIPLLTAYSLYKRKSVTIWLPGVLVAVALLAGYELMTQNMYGKGLLLSSFNYAQTYHVKNETNPFVNAMIALSFLGGCVLSSLFYAPLLYRRKMIIYGALTVLIIGVSLFYIPALRTKAITGTGVQYHILAQFPIFALGGFVILFLALQDFFRNRDGASLLLLLWVFGTFAFAGFFNWTISARAILPIAPAVGLLISRKLEGFEWANDRRVLFAPLAPCLVLSVLVTWADFNFANSARSAAHHISQKYSDKIWFQGHWGFQYYMEGLGGENIDWNKAEFDEGDLIVMPSVNANVVPLSETYFSQEETITLTPSGRFSTMSTETGAGFYSSVYGPLPYAIGPKFIDKYIIDRSKTDIIIEPK